VSHRRAWFITLHRKSHWKNFDGHLFVRRAYWINSRRTFSESLTLDYWINSRRTVSASLTLAYLINARQTFLTLFDCHFIYGQTKTLAYHIKANQTVSCMDLIHAVSRMFQIHYICTFICLSSDSWGEFSHFLGVWLEVYWKGRWPTAAAQSLVQRNENLIKLIVSKAREQRGRNLLSSWESMTPGLLRGHSDIDTYTAKINCGSSIYRSQGCLTASVR